MERTIEHAALIQLIDRYKADPESVYNTWFVSSAERMKAFRAIRRGIRDTVNSIAAGTFGNGFKGSALEFVLQLYLSRVGGSVTSVSLTPR